MCPRHVVGLSDIGKTMMVEFKRRDTLGGGLSIEVRNDGLIVGHIRKRPDTGAFRYFRGESNDLSAVYPIVISKQ